MTSDLLAAGKIRVRWLLGLRAEYPTGPPAGRDVFGSGRSFACGPPTLRSDRRARSGASGAEAPAGPGPAPSPARSPASRRALAGLHRVPRSRAEGPGFSLG